MLTEYPDWKLWRCRLKLKHFDDVTPPENRRSTRYAAASFSPEMLKGYDLLWNVWCLTAQLWKQFHGKCINKSAFQILMTNGRKHSVCREKRVLMWLKSWAPIRLCFLSPRASLSSGVAAAATKRELPAVIQAWLMSIKLWALLIALRGYYKKKSNTMFVLAEITFSVIGMWYWTHSYVFLRPIYA